MRDKLKKKINKIVPLLILAVSLFLLLPGGSVRAESGTVYTCKVNPCYAHPVTGTIEDAGGASSTATGQGMVEGCLGTTGILEVTDGGSYYLTFCMGLIDYTSNHSFSVQNVNDSGWSSVSAEVTGSGSDDNGKTSYMRVQVPSESCIVRCSMYVDPMGRDVIFYFYPSDYTEGNSTDMTAGIVTETSSGSDSSGTAQTSSDSTQAESMTEAAAATTASSGSASSLQSSVTSGSSSTDATASSEDDTLNDTQGLSLSTAPDSSDSDEEESGGTGTLTLVLAICAAFTISGLILLFTGAWLVYYFRKNWKRWGAGDDMEELADAGEEEDAFMAEGFGLPDEETDIWDSEGVVREENLDYAGEDEPGYAGGDDSDYAREGDPGCARIEVSDYGEEEWDEED